MKQRKELSAALLMFAILDPDQYAESVVTGYDDFDFDDGTHKAIYKSIKVLYDNGNVITGITVSEQLKEYGINDGGDQIAAMIADDPPLLLLSEYKKIDELLINIITAVKANEHATQPISPIDPQKDIDTRIELLTKISNRRGGAETKPVGKMLNDDFIENSLTTATDHICLPANWNLGTFKRYYPGRLSVIGGVPGCGKTTFCLQIAEAAAQNEHNIPVIFYSFEQSFVDLVNRLIEGHINIPVLNKVAEYGRDNCKEDIEKYKDAFTEFKKRNSENLYILQANQTTTTQVIRSKIREIKQRHNVPYVMLVIDYLQVIPTVNKLTGRDYPDKRTSIDAVLSEIARICIDAPAAALVISSTPRGAVKTGDKENKPQKPKSNRPDQHVFKESGQIEYSAWNAGCFYDYEGNGIIDRIAIVKGRSGGEGYDIVFEESINARPGLRWDMKDADYREFQ